MSRRLKTWIDWLAFWTLAVALATVFAPRQQWLRVTLWILTAISVITVLATFGAISARTIRESLRS